ncbi:hypothetical protein BGZ97_012196 [Linnemannia gamsii]|uniref:Extracellular membrane protein CFEM domain-containing protein n=1 Tax=Linnemannia gamsii TaxID=64522 RepID=A0A9P6R6M9_9FUNG|nr:hypothetical protein BGZ97_012196 [Linnemannia gamsii]
MFAIVLAALSGPASVVSAQTVPVTEACLQCYSIAGTAVSPTCTPELLLTNNLPAEMTPQEKICFCPLAETTTDWLLSCVKPGACTTENIDNLYSAYTAPEFRDIVCSTGGAPPPSVPIPSPVSSSSVGPAPLPPSATSSVVTQTRGTPAVTTTTSSPAAPSPTTNDAAGARFGGSSQVLTGLTIVVVAAAHALF